jgi:hypothetical protein
MVRVTRPAPSFTAQYHFERLTTTTDYYQLVLSQELSLSSALLLGPCVMHWQRAELTFDILGNYQLGLIRDYSIDIRLRPVKLVCFSCD